MKNKDLRMGLTMMVLWIILFGLSFTFKSSDVVKSHTTASFFPQVVLLVAMFFTVIMIYQSIRNGPDEVVEKADDHGEVKKRVLLSMVAAIGFGFGVSYLGTLVSISLFIIATMLVWGVRNKVSILLNAILTPIIIYVIFTKLLWVQLPAGILI
jgi:hypothetical protein